MTRSENLAAAQELVRDAYGPLHAMENHITPSVQSIRNSCRLLERAIQNIADARKQPDATQEVIDAVRAFITEGEQTGGRITVWDEPAARLRAALAKL